MTLASKHPSRTVLLGTNGPPFNRYTVRYYNVEPESGLQSHRAPSSSSLSKHVTRIVCGCDVIELFFLAGLALIVGLYAIDYGLDLRRTGFQTHLALCAAATLLSIIHVAVQLISAPSRLLNSKPTLYDNSAIGMLVEKDFTADDDNTDFGKRCYNRCFRCSSTDAESAFTVALGVTGVLVNVLVLVAFYVREIDLGWSIVQSVIFPVSTGAARMAAKGRVYHEMMRRDADVSRAVLMEAAYLMREQLLLFPENSLSTTRSNDNATTQSSPQSTQRYGEVCDNVRRFVTALRNSPCYSARETGLRLVHHQQNDGRVAQLQWKASAAAGDGSINRRDYGVTGPAADSPATAVDTVECRLVSVVVNGKEKQDSSVTA